MTSILDVFVRAVLSRYRSPYTLRAESCDRRGETVTRSETSATERYVDVRNSHDRARAFISAALNGVQHCAN